MKRLFEDIFNDVDVHLIDEPINSKSEIFDESDDCPSFEELSKEYRVLMSVSYSFNVQKIKEGKSNLCDKIDTIGDIDNLMKMHFVENLENASGIASYSRPYKFDYTAKSLFTEDNSNNAIVDYQPSSYSIWLMCGVNVNFHSIREIQNFLIGFYITLKKYNKTDNDLHKTILINHISFGFYSASQAGPSYNNLERYGIYGISSIKLYKGEPKNTNLVYKTNLYHFLIPNMSKYRVYKKLCDMIDFVFDAEYFKNMIRLENKGKRVAFINIEKDIIGFDEWCKLAIDENFGVADSINGNMEHAIDSNYSWNRENKIKANIDTLTQSFGNDIPVYFILAFLKRGSELTIRYTFVVSEPVVDDNDLRRDCINYVYIYLNQIIGSDRAVSYLKYNCERLGIDFRNVLSQIKQLDAQTSKPLNIPAFNYSDEQIYEIQKKYKYV